jgi:uncharacterized protein (DUF1697 family)
MPIFVAFLRGINIGSHLVKKGQLQEIFASLGFINVSAFKQSGNVILETDSGDSEKIRRMIEEELCKILGYEVAVFVRTIAQLKSIIDLDPFKGQDKEGNSFLVTMLANPHPEAFSSELPLTIPKSTAQVILVKGAEVFSVTHGGGEGALPNPFVEKKLKVKATTRNINILEQIVEKYSM